MRTKILSKRHLIETAILFFIILLLWTPNSYSYILPPLFYSAWRWGQYIMAFTLCILVLVLRKENKVFILNLIFSITLLMSTWLYHGSVNKCLNYVAPLLGTVSLITYCMRSNKHIQLFQSMKIVLITYILINIVSYFLFPKGLYTTELVTWTIEKPNTFLGNRNAYKYYGLLFIFVSYLYRFIPDIEERSKRKGIGVAITLALAMEILGGSLTGILVIGGVVLYYFLGVKGLEIKRISPKLLFLMAFVAFILIAFFATTEWFTHYLAMIFDGNVNFSNRTRIWLAVEKIILANPILGIGTQTSETLFGLFRNLNAHNQFLEVAMRGGIAALVIYVLIIWEAFKKLSFFTECKVVSFVSICLFAALIINMVECETYSYAIISYFTAFAYNWNYKSEAQKVHIHHRYKIVLRESVLFK